MPMLRPPSTLMLVTSTCPSPRVPRLPSGSVPAASSARTSPSRHQAELAAGALPLGSRGTRGLGQVEVTGIRVEGGPSLGVEDWALAAPSQDGGAGAGLAEQILDRLRSVNEDIAASPGAGDNWTGWSSYLCDPEEARDE